MKRRCLLFFEKVNKDSGYLALLILSIFFFQTSTLLGQSSDLRSLPSSHSSQATSLEEARQLRQHQMEVFLLQKNKAASASQESPVAKSGLSSANDEWEDAEELTCGESVDGSNVGATQSDEAQYPNNLDVWYTYTPGTTQQVTFSTCGTADFDTKLEFFDASLNRIGSNDDGAGCDNYTSRINALLEGGATYYISVGGHKGQTGDFSLSLECEAVTVLEGGLTCDVAIPLTCGETIIGSTLDAIDPVQSGAPGTAGIEPQAPGKWYTITMDERSVVRLSTCNGETNYDSDIEVYEGGDCSTGGTDLSLVASSDFGSEFCFNGSVFNADVVFTAEADVTYKVFVNGFVNEYSGPKQGRYELSVYCSTAECEVYDISGLLAADYGLFTTVCTDEIPPLCEEVLFQPEDLSGSCTSIFVVELSMGAYYLTNPADWTVKINGVEISFEYLLLDWGLLAIQTSYYGYGSTDFEISFGEDCGMSVEGIVEVPEECGTFTFLGDFVWEDLDNDGIQDDGESGVEGVTVSLFDSSGDLIATTITDENGYYNFYPPPGNYYVVFENVPDYYYVPRDQTSDDLDSDVTFSITTGEGTSDVFNVTIPYFNPDLDAGLSSCPPLSQVACNDNVNVILDDNCEALITPDMILEGNYICYKELIVDVIAPGDISLGNVVPAGYAGEQLIVSVTDPTTGYSCWGQITLEDKTAPAFDCTPTDIYQIDGRDLICTDIDEVFNQGVLEVVFPAPGFSDNCNIADFGFEDVLNDGGNCAVTTITRTWYAVDNAGHEAGPCVQTIHFSIPTLDDVERPTDEVQVECDFVQGLLDANGDLTEADLLDENGHPTPLALELLHGEGAGYPYLYGQALDESYCNIGADYEDISVINICENTVKIVRQWTILDWCDIGDQDDLNNGTLVNHRQVIKFGDFTAPVVTDPGDKIYAYTSGISCEGSFTIPGVDVDDNCVADADLAIEATLYELVIVDLLGNYGQVVGQTEDYVEIGAVTIGEDYKAVAMGTTYKVVYVVTDLCGNTSTPVEILVEAQDDDAPVAVCDDDLHISIGGDGLARVTDQDVDEGSWDNCGDVETWVSRKLASEALRDAYLAKVHELTFDDLEASSLDDKDQSSGAVIWVKKDTNEEILREKDGMLYTWWEKEIYFLCDDIAERVTIELLAEDEVGLTNICWNDVLIEDKIAPHCEVPADINWDCTELPYGFDPNDDAQLADLFGNASATDNCSGAIAFQISKTVDWNCNSGTITRTFQASDARGLTSNNTCTQTINIAQVHNYEMIFPADPVPVVCGEATLGELIANTIACDLLTVNVVNDTFAASGDACHKIKRTYSVINWCEYDGESPAVEVSRDEDGDGVAGEHDVYVLRDAVLTGDYNVYIDDDADEKDAPLRRAVSTGYWTYIQYIKVIDNIEPVVEIGGDDVFCSINNIDCNTEVTIPITVRDECAGPDVEVKAFVDGEQVTVDGEYQNYSITGDYAIGDHELEVHAVDGCRNSELVVKRFTVSDCKAPTPICLNGLAVELMPTEDGGGAMAVWVSDFVVSGLEDCVGEDNITLSINRVGDTPDITSDGLILTCDDPDTLAVEIYAWDNANNPTAIQPDASIGGSNYDHCVTYVVIQDNMFDLCGAPGEVGLAGLITSENNETVENVEVNLTGGESANMFTSANGRYNFATLTAGADYTVTPIKDNGYTNGVSTFDLVLITKHILGSKRLISPYKLIAADVNNSRSITALDLIHLRKLILSIRNSFTNNTSWRFIPAGYQFPDSTNPWAQQFPEVLNYNNLQSLIADGDFMAVKIGDVNGNAVPNSLIVDERSLTDVFYLSVADQSVLAGNEYRIAFTAKDLSVQGYQFTLNHNGLELIDIEYGVAQEEHFGVIEDGVITTSWNLPVAFESGDSNGQSGDSNGPNGQQHLFTLVVRAQQNALLSELLNVNSHYTPAEAYDANDELLGVNLNFGEGNLEESFRLEQNVPNPFMGNTTIGFELPKATEATIRIHDVSGTTLKVIRGEYAKGQNQVNISSDNLPVTGVLFYTLKTDEFTATRKMVVMGE